MTVFLEADQLSFSYPDGSPLFRQLSLVLMPGHYGLYGRNGSGKSTLLSLLAQQQRPLSGRIHHAGKCRFLPQQPGLPWTVLPDIAAALQALIRVSDGQGTEADFGVCSDDWGLPGQISRVLQEQALITVPMDAAQLLHWLSSQPAQLSGGQRQRLLLALMFVLQPDILLLDEPGNDLDEDGRHWLNGQIAAFRGVLLIASHQPLLLQEVDSILWLHDGTLQRYGGGFAIFSAQRQLEQAAAERRLEDSRDELRQLQRQAQLSREKADRRARSGRRQRQDGSQSKMLLDRQQQKAEQHRGAQARLQQQRLQRAEQQLGSCRQQLGSRQDIHWPLPAPVLRSGWVLQAGGLQLPRGSTAAVSFTLRQGERWHLAGRNGSGKTTLLQLLSGELTAAGGEIRRRTEVIRLEQQGLPPLTAVTALGFLQQQCPGISTSQLRSWLAGLGMDAGHCQRSLAQLSGGERMKLALLALSWSRPGALLLLDEPDNHLDGDSRDQLQQALRAWPGALLIVSHDADFIAGCGVQHTLRLS